MGIKIASWQEAFILSLNEAGYHVSAINNGRLTLVDFEGYGNLLLNLISIHHNLQPLEISTLQQEYENAGKQFIQLWEDMWLNRPLQVLSRICSLLGRNQKIHGRKTTIKSITQSEADHFLIEHHLQGSAKARYRYALEADGKCVAVATFSAKRKMTRIHADYNSVELIRFATASGYTVQGGLSKLIKHLINQLKPNDIMSYADLDWSNGKGYTHLGFQLIEQTAPANIWLDENSLVRYFPHRLPGGSANTNYAPVFNMGNRKYILYL